MNLPNYENAPGPPPAKDFNYDAVEEMAYHGFTLEEILEVIEVDPFWFDQIHSQFSKAYLKGFLKSQLELRQRIFLDAKHGSSPAQALAIKILDAAAFKMDNK